MTTSESSADASPENQQRRICDLTRDDLVEWCGEQGEASYRADQIRRWIFSKRVNEFAEMHDVPQPLREKLVTHFRLFSTKVVQHLVATDRTEKLLLQLDDGNHVEAVLMRETKRQTVCISTQVGCAMGCVFCASGLKGLNRNLSSGEILEQVLQLDRLLSADERITNVVVMGIGEPLQNLPALLQVLETLNEKGGLGLGARRMTISTVGLPKQIQELAAVGKAYNLAISLHAPNDALRTKLVPVNKGVGIEELLAAADNYFVTTGRRISYEYVLIGEINDQPIHASQLAKLLRGRNAHVNIIPMNNVEELPFAHPDKPRTERFVRELEKAGIVVTVRKRKGADIDAACGQLRLKEEQPKIHQL